VLTIRILGDGTINSVKLAQSSGYTDIDQRIQRMVFAVGQYPPLPPRMPGTWMDFTFLMVFPDALER
jgi:TonB family protein